ncbi:MAG: hypothetical protein HY457_02830 [Parcubacteria group bacterium]|nr:hypothetical protein [Parcubacteria group bacterium]
MKEFIKQNFALVLAFALPLALIIVVALGAYLPSLFLSTDYNFIYSTCTGGPDYRPINCQHYLQKPVMEVVEGGLVVHEIDPGQDFDKNGVLDIKENYTARIFLHDTEKNESREITLEEAKMLTLNGLLTSPDGVSVSSDYSRGPEFFPFFGGNSSYGYYLVKGKSKSKLNLINDNDRYYYQNNFQFIGWVLPGRSLKETTIYE